MIFVGIDWAEAHHDVRVLDEHGGDLAKGRIADGLEGVAAFHAMVAEHAGAPDQVLIGIETDRGLLVGALVASGYRVYAVNPLAASRYRGRHTTSRAKSDRGDAKVLADLVRTDRHNHRRVAGDSELVDAVRVLARAHQNLVWARQRQVNALRSALREFYPGALAAFGTDLASPDALAVLRRAPTPAAGRALALAALGRLLRTGGRQRRVAGRAAEIQAALRVPQLAAPAPVAEAYGALVRAAVPILAAMSAQLLALEAALAAALERHPAAPIVCSLPGLGPVLGSRVLGEFGDDPTRDRSPKARKAYAGTAPITRASGTRRTVLARVGRKRRLFDACFQWAFSALKNSPGARRYYDQSRARGHTHDQAVRALANRLVGILHGCLAHAQPYREDVAWPPAADVASSSKTCHR
jgi:transposase